MDAFVEGLRKQLRTRDDELRVEQERIRAAIEALDKSPVVASLKPKRGRPRKVIDESPVVAKPKRGRPRKVKPATSDLFVDQLRVQA